MHVDSRSAGVGGYDSWSPNVDEEFRIKCSSSEDYATSVLLMPMANEGDQGGAALYSSFIQGSFGGLTGNDFS